MKSWMTKTGAILTGLGTTVGGSAQVVPDTDAKQWMTVAAIVLAGLGQAMMGVGIRRRIPAEQ